MKIYANAIVDHRGVLVNVSVDNEFPLPTWEYWTQGQEGRWASVRAVQSHDDDDVTGPVLWEVTIEGERIQGDVWAWELCHRKVLDYVAFGTVPVWGG